jgi:hypothetical protein
MFTELPILGLCVNPIEEPLLLLLFGYVEKELHDHHAVLCEVTFVIKNGSIPFEP